MAERNKFADPYAAKVEALAKEKAAKIEALVAAPSSDQGSGPGAVTYGNVSLKHVERQGDGTVVASPRPATATGTTKG